MGGGLTFGFIHFAVTSPFLTQKMSEPMLLDDLQLEETDTIDKVESAVDVPEEAPIRLPSFKAKQKPITSWFKSQLICDG